MGAKTMNSLSDFGFCEMALIDGEGYVVAELGSIGDNVVAECEGIASFVGERDYLAWGVGELSFVAYPLKNDFLFVGRIDRAMPLTKALFMRSEIRKGANRFLEEL